MMPMIDFMVVVLPAPLRPSSVTTSPGITSKVMPCRTWLSPYQASRPLTDRRGAVAARGCPARAALAMTGSDVSFDHPGILRDAGVIALGEHVSAREHGDAVGQRGDDGQIV